MNSDLKITVITVCFNSESTIEETVNSVLNQTYSNIEYIIIDGKSTDRTISLIEKYKNIKIISEPDNGIYDAMNKGIDLSTGDYIIFMNSGDKFIDSDVICKICTEIEDEKYGFYYGNIITSINNKIIERVKFDKVKFNMFNVLRGASICHQAMITKTNLLKDNKFDLSYPICADKDFMIKMIRKGVKCKYIDLDISVYDRSGVSSIQCYQLQQEAESIMFKYYPVGAKIIYFLKKIKYKINTKGYRSN